MIAITALLLPGCPASAPTPVPPPKPPATMVPDTPPTPSPRAASAFDGMSVDEKLTKIADAIRAEWGDGHGFLPEPEDQPAPKPGIEFLLTLRWQDVELKVRPMLKEAFGIDDELRCRFMSPGQFETNNAFYQLAVFRAQGLDVETVVLSQAITGTLVTLAPAIKDEYFQAGRTDVINFDAIRGSLVELTIPFNESSGLTFDREWNPAGLSPNSCELRTTWVALPAAVPVAPESKQFRWRLILTVREAATETHTEDMTVSSEAGRNRIEAVSSIQFVRNSAEPYDAVGLLLVTPIGFDDQTQIIKWRTAYKKYAVPTREILEDPEKFRGSQGFPTPTTFVGASDAIMSVLRVVHAAVEMHLTKQE